MVVAGRFYREERFSTTVHISLNIGRFTQVRADLREHKGAAKVFFERTVDLDGPLLLLCIAGPDVQKLRGEPVPNVLVKAKCHSRDFRSGLYKTESWWDGARVLEAIRSPLADLNVSLLRSNHPSSYRRSLSLRYYG